MANSTVFAGRSVAQIKDGCRMAWSEADEMAMLRFAATNKLGRNTKAKQVRALAAELGWAFGDAPELDDLVMQKLATAVCYRVKTLLSLLVGHEWTFHRGRPRLQAVWSDEAVQQVLSPSFVLPDVSCAVQPMSLNTVMEDRPSAPNNTTGIHPAAQSTRGLLPPAEVAHSSPPAMASHHSAQGGSSSVRSNQDPSSAILATLAPLTQAVRTSTSDPYAPVTSLAAVGPASSSDSAVPNSVPTPAEAPPAPVRPIARARFQTALSTTHDGESLPTHRGTGRPSPPNQTSAAPAGTINHPSTPATVTAAPSIPAPNSALRAGAYVQQPSVVRPQDSRPPLDGAPRSGLSQSTPKAVQVPHASPAPPVVSAKPLAPSADGIVHIEQLHQDMPRYTTKVSLAGHNAETHVGLNIASAMKTLMGLGMTPTWDPTTGMIGISPSQSQSASQPAHPRESSLPPYPFEEVPSGPSNSALPQQSENPTAATPLHVPANQASPTRHPAQQWATPGFQGRHAPGPGQPGHAAREHRDEAVPTTQNHSDDIARPQHGTVLTPVSQRALDSRHDHVGQTTANSPPAEPGPVSGADGEDALSAGQPVGESTYQALVDSVQEGLNVLEMLERSGQRSPTTQQHSAPESHSAVQHPRLPQVTSSDVPLHEHSQPRNIAQESRDFRLASSSRLSSIMEHLGGAQQQTHPTPSPTSAQYSISPHHAQPGRTSEPSSLTRIPASPTRPVIGHGAGTVGNASRAPRKDHSHTIEDSLPLESELSRRFDIRDQLPHSEEHDPPYGVSTSSHHPTHATAASPPHHVHFEQHTSSNGPGEWDTQHRLAPASATHIDQDTAMTIEEPLFEAATVRPPSRVQPKSRLLRDALARVSHGLDWAASATEGTAYANVGPSAGMSSSPTGPGPTSSPTATRPALQMCEGTTRHGERCRRRAAMGYCHQHQPVHNSSRCVAHSCERVTSYIQKETKEPLCFEHKIASQLEDIMEL